MGIDALLLVTGLALDPLVLCDKTGDLDLVNGVYGLRWISGYALGLIDLGYLCPDLYIMFL